VADFVKLFGAALRDRYLVERELGSGGMARVYLARDLRHGRPVAVKVLRPELSSVLAATRFLREIELTARLQHTHILPLYDSGETDGQLWYVMPFVDGGTLRERLRDDGQLPLDEALLITRQVLAALACAHEHGIVHRDVKPENILLSRGGALVSDFGIAHAITAAGTARLTETGLAIGTAAYMSPEQATADRRIDRRSDIYSLGCVLYEMLAGEPPYTGASRQAIIAKRLSEPLPRLSVVREAVPSAIEQVLVTALAKAPADRFATAEAFSVALQRAAMLPARTVVVSAQRKARAGLVARGGARRAGCGRSRARGPGIQTGTGVPARARGRCTARESNRRFHPR
jgi:serine/threonine protein kinase